MIQENYVNFECAKLLEEKGFPQELGEKGCVNTIPYYTQNGGFVTCDLNTIRQRWYPKAAAPTLQMAMKWLRENHRLFIEIGVSIDLNGNYHYDFRILNYLCKDVLSINDYAKMKPKDTFEKAAQEAIMYCLNNLI